MLSPGTLLQNRYRIVRRIGQGGMGAVYEARHEELGHAVALKEAFHTEDISLRRAFKREARMLASLQHTSLPRVTDYFNEGDGLFLVMEYIAGDDLMELLNRRAHAFPVSEVLHWADQLLDVLHYLHMQEPPVIHRDIKPNNIKLDGRGHIVLLDFGLAKGTAGEVTSVVASRSVLGFTLTYAPLEQILKADQNLVEHLSVFGKDKIESILQSRTDARSDLYALGATLYYLLTKRQPSQSPTRALAVWSGKADPLSPANEINSQVSPAVAAVLRQAMELESGNRPASALQMRHMLREAERTLWPESQGAGAEDRDRSKTAKDEDPAPPPSPTVASPRQTANARSPARPPHDSSEEVTKAAESVRNARRSLPKGLWAMVVVLVTALIAAGVWLATSGTKQTNGGEEIRRWLTMLDSSENVPEVVRQTTAALEQAPRNALALRARSAAYYVSGETDQGKRDSEEVERLLESATSVEEYEARCYARFRLAKWDKAVSDCTRAIELDPRYKWAYNYRGVVYEQKGEHERAIADYNKALELDPWYVTVYNNRGAAYIRKDKYNEGLADYNKALELDPQYTMAYYNRGVLYYEKGKYNEAITDFDKVIKLNPRHAGAYFHRGAAYHNKKDRERAMADYSNAIKLNPQDARAYLWRGTLYHFKKDYRSAMADYDKAIEIAPKYAMAYYQRASIYSAQEDYDRAIADFDKSIELDPSDAGVYNDRGVVYVKKKEFARAIADYSKAIEIDPRDALYYQNRASVYEAQGESERAAADLKKASELEKQKP